MGKADIPAFLYHYTTVDSLALILKNKNIQFRPLTMMDDLQEENEEKRYKLARFVFVSSWTAEKIESIPMWKMYSSWEQGIRIKLPSSPFEKYMVSSKEYEEVTGKPPRYKEQTDTWYIKPFREMYESDYTYLYITSRNLLYKIRYTNCEGSENAEDVKLAIYDKVMDFGKVGNKKSIAWRFQKEWRYKFICLPIKAIFGKDFDTIHNEFIYHKLLNNEYRMPMDRIFLSLTDAAFSQMEITCSPKLSESNRIFIDLLKEKYNPTLTVRESTLKDSIR